MSPKAASLGRSVCALLFLSGALVQYNDPDPLRWVAMYLLAATACVAAGRFAKSWLPPLIIALVALGWAVSLGLQMPSWVAPTQMFEPMETRGGAVEMAREMWGLGIMALILLVVSLTARRPLRSPA